ncbi:MAG: GntR family transcriptional regulator [Butyrivibrio sp.]|nr:GntR family transcriptional regulator [Butyrivibrio sp.]
MKTKTQIVKDYLIDIIVSSPVGTKIPSERELVSHLGFSRPIVQNAINSLLAAGYLYKVDRQGTFIAQNMRLNVLNRLRSFDEVAYDLNVMPSTEILDQDTITAGDILSSELDCSPDETIHYFLRLRKHSGIPVELDFSYYSDFAVSKITQRDLQKSIHRYIEDVKKLTISSSTSSIDAVFPEPEIAKYLEVSEDEPLLQLDTYSRLSDGRLFEHTISYIVSKYYKLSVISAR